MIGNDYDDDEILILLCVRILERNANKEVMRTPTVTRFVQVDVGIA